MYIDIIPKRQARSTVLLREAWRAGKNRRKRTVATLTHWPAAKIEARRRVLRAEPLAPPQSLCVVEHSLPHGAVEAIGGTIGTIGLALLLATKPCRERQRVLAMMAKRLLQPRAKRGTTRRWHTPTWAEALGGTTADADDLDDAMDGGLARQARSEQKRAQRPVAPGAHGLYNVTRR